MKQKFIKKKTKYILKILNKKSLKYKYEKISKNKNIPQWRKTKRTFSLKNQKLKRNKLSTYAYYYIKRKGYKNNTTLLKRNKNKLKEWEQFMKNTNNQI